MTTKHQPATPRWSDGDSVRAQAALVRSLREDRRKLVEALAREIRWRAREAVGELGEGWDYEAMVAQPRTALLRELGEAQ